MTVGQLIKQLRQTAPYDAPVVLSGETELGTTWSNPDFSLRFDGSRYILYIVEEQ